MVTYAPYTVASVYALFSGMDGTQNGVDSYYGSLDFDEKNCFTLTQDLSEKGYYTKADVLSKIILPHQGFAGIDIHDEYNDDLRLRHKELIKETKAKKPFFLFLHYSNIHTGIMSEVVNKFSDFDQSYFSRKDENIRRYDGFVQKAAEYLEDILGFCRREGLAEDTLFVILTDHGCSLGEKPGEKCYGVFTYDYTVMTFAYFIYPAVLPMNREVNLLTRTIDIAPTVLELLGIIPKGGYKKMQGRSLYSAMLGKDSRDRGAYIETAALSGPHPSPYKPNICAYRTRDWKLIYNETTAEKELYNLKNDPEENFNLIGQHTAVENELWIKIKENGNRIFCK